MILVLWLARLLWWVSVATKRAGDALYAMRWDREVARLTRAQDRMHIDRVIAETGGDPQRTLRRTRVGSPIHRDR